MASISIMGRVMNMVFRALNVKVLFEDAGAARGDYDAFLKVVGDARNHVIMQAEPSDRFKNRYPYEQIDIDGSNLHLSKIGNGKQVVLAIHGGAFPAPTAFNVWNWYEKVCKAADYDLAMFDHPLSPENTAKDIIPSVLKAYQCLIERYGAENVVFSGESSGGNIALSTSMQAREQGLPQPKLSLLLYPFIDGSVSHPEALEVQKHDLALTVDGLQSSAEFYAGDLELTDPLVSPYFGSVDGLAPIHILQGTHDLLYPGNRDFAQKAQAAGHDTHFYPYEGMQHTWLLWPTMPESRHATNKAIEILKA